MPNKCPPLVNSSIFSNPPKPYLDPSFINFHKMKSAIFANLLIYFALVMYFCHFCYFITFLTFLTFLPKKVNNHSYAFQPEVIFSKYLQLCLPFLNFFEYLLVAMAFFVIFFIYYESQFYHL